MELEQRELPAGTVVHVGGIPVRLVSSTVAATNDENWQFIVDTVLIQTGQPVKRVDAEA